MGISLTAITGPAKSALNKSKRFLTASGNQVRGYVTHPGFREAAGAGAGGVLGNEAGVRLVRAFPNSPKVAKVAMRGGLPILGGLGGREFVRKAIPAIRNLFR